MGNLDIALWDVNTLRAVSLKERLDMFSGDSGTTLIPVVPVKPIGVHDVVFLSFDECDAPVQKVARAVRESRETTFIILISDRLRNLAPMFRPRIRPDGILFRPVLTAHIRSILDEVSSELDRLAHTETKDIFVFKSDGSLHRLYYRDILFFEACVKKVRIHIRGQEIGYYDSLEHLSASLPQYFIRCHRGYIVNARMIMEFHASEMELILTSGERIPFSRLYRDVLKQYISG